MPKPTPAQRARKSADKAKRRADTLKSEARGSGGGGFTELRDGRILAPGLAARLASQGDVHRCLAPKPFGKPDFGTVVMSRRLSDGGLAAAVFLLDPKCLGVKRAFLRSMSPMEFDVLLAACRNSGEDLVDIDSSECRRMIEECSAWAARNGIPQPAGGLSYLSIFPASDGAAPKKKFEFGDENGEPLYVVGPHESAPQIRDNLKRLSKACGPNGFNYVIPILSDHEMAIIASGMPDRK